MFQTPLMTEPKQQTDTLFTVTETQLGWTRNGENWRNIPMDQFRALVRVKEIDGAARPITLNIVSGTYKLIQNYELYDHIESVILSDMPTAYLKDVQIVDKAAYHGLRTWRQYIFPNFSTQVNGKSKIGFRVIVQNAYGGAALKIISGAIDFYCTNGMITGQFESEYYRHSSGLTVQGVGDNLKQSMRKFIEASDEWKKWNERVITHEAAMSLFHKIAASPRMFTKFTETWEQEAHDRGQTKWALYSTLTHYASHRDGAFKTRDTGNDSEAATMMKRELDVMKWIKLPEFENA